MISVPTRTDAINMSTDYRTIVATWTDEMIALSLTGCGKGQAVRDMEGNLRDLTDAERAFIAAARAEWRARWSESGRQAVMRWTRGPDISDAR